MRYELRPFNIRVKIIEPGVIKTYFYSRSMTIVKNDALKEYEAYSDKVISNILKNEEKGSSPKDAAKTIYKAATDNSPKLRYPTGYSRGLIPLRKMLPLNFFTSLVRNSMENE